MKEKILRCCNVDSLVLLAAIIWFVAVVSLILF
jgi:hypothetical protein